jgi:hypothetical protein
MCVVVLCKVCRSAIALSVNPLTNPNPVCSHTYVTISSRLTKLCFSELQIRQRWIVTKLSEHYDEFGECFSPTSERAEMVPGTVHKCGSPQPEMPWQKPCFLLSLVAIFVWFISKSFSPVSLLLILIQLLGKCTVRKWAVLQTFRRYMLLPSSG